MKKTLEVFVVAEQYAWEDTPRFSVLGFDPRTCDIDSYYVISQTSMDVEIPNDFDMRPHQIAVLEKKKQEVREKFAMAVKELDDQINSLLAIGTAKVVEDGTAN